MCFFFFNDTATTEIYTLSLHDALPIFRRPPWATRRVSVRERRSARTGKAPQRRHFRSRRPETQNPCSERSEEHTSELQSRQYLVCRLLLEKKKNTSLTHHHDNVYEYNL